VVKVSRPPIPLGDPDALAAALDLAPRMPYSGAEYGYYHGYLAPEFAPTFSVDVLYPGCLEDATDEVSASAPARAPMRVRMRRRCICFLGFHFPPFASNVIVQPLRGNTLQYSRL
jgi:hypothetical protein